MATIRSIASWLSTRRRIVGLALFGWVVVAVVASGGPAGSDDWITVPDLSPVIVAAAAALMFVGLGLVLFTRPGNRAPFDPPESRSLRTLILATTFFVLLVVIFGPDGSSEEALPVEPEQPLVADPDGSGINDDPSAGTSTSDVIAVVLLVVVAGAVLLRSGRRSDPGGPDHVMDSEMVIDGNLRAAIDDAAAHLDLGADPRTAVLAAYASLERAFGVRGQNRHPAETPSEHLARVLAGAPSVAVPAVQLGRLYELARFSDHAITDDDRDRAADALAAAQRSMATFATHTP